MKNKVILFISICVVVTLLVTLGIYFYVNSYNELKIDKDKTYVYDAVFDTGNLVSSYTKQYGVFYLSDIVMPFINIDSSDAVIANNNIKDIYNELLKTYEKGISDSFTFVEYADYEYYINDDLLSLYITYGISTQSGSVPNTLTYNFNLNNGKLVKFNKATKYMGVKDIDKKVKGEIKKTVDGFISDSSKKDYYINKAYDNYLNSEEIMYYYDSNGDLNIVLEFIVPYDSGIDYYVLTIK